MTVGQKRKPLTTTGFGRFFLLPIGFLVPGIFDAKSTGSLTLVIGLASPLGYDRINLSASTATATSRWQALRGTFSEILINLLGSLRIAWVNDED